MLSPPAMGIDVFALSSIKESIYSSVSNGSSNQAIFNSDNTSDITKAAGKLNLPWQSIKTSKSGPIAFRISLILLIPC